MTYKEIAQQLNEDIRDAKLKKLLFGTEELDSFSIKEIDTLYKILTFAFMYLFIRYKYKKLNDVDLLKSQNSERVFKAFDNIFTTENVELSLMFYVIKEALIDEDKRQRNSEFHQVINGNGDINSIIEINNIIKVWLLSSKKAESNIQKLSSLLKYLLDIFVGLYDISFIEEEDGNLSIHSRKDGIDYPTYGLIKSIDNKLYFLYSFEKIDNNTYSVNYKEFGTYENMQSLQIEKSTFNKTLQNRTPKNPKRILIKNNFPKQYSYLNNLSLAISETLTEDNKEDIFYSYRDNYPYIFTMDGKMDVKNIDFYNTKIENWDEIISMLILEVSPTGLLKSVFDSRGFNFEEFIRNLAIRYGDNNIPNLINDNVRKYETVENRNANRFNVQITREKDLYNQIKINCKIKSVMECLSKKESIQYETFSNEFVGTLEIIKSRILQIENSTDSVKAKTLEINYLLEGVFRYLLCFYKGIIRFAEKKQELISKSIFENSSSFSIDYKECANAFFDEVSKRCTEYESLSLGKLLGVIRDFSVEIYNGSTITDKSKALFDVIGRYDFVNQKKLNDIIEFTKDEANVFIENYPDKKPINNIVLFINTAKHNKPNYPQLTERGFDIFKIHINRLLDYLLYNENDDISYDVNHVSTHPVYPYVVYYSSSIGNRDGIKIPQFSVSLKNKEGKQIEKKILSGIEYDISKKYYCIPNNVTSNEHWWIEPFLIDSNEFDIKMESNFNDKAKDTDDEDFTTQSK